MSTGKGIVAITRQVFGEQPQDDSDFSSLVHSPADSLMRKLCASCHLDHDKTAHRLDSPRRGGGCLACHINTYPEKAHPRLTARVEDRRCFGCHSRSARISLNYRGLSEVEAAVWQRPRVSGLQHLEDGRLVQQAESDVHQRAGMGCIDCHTGPGLMGSAQDLNYAREAVDIQCVDCHRNTWPRLWLDAWPEAFAGYKDRIPFPAGPEQTFLTTARKGTPLWHVEVEGKRLWLHRKLAGGRIEIPQYTSVSHPMMDYAEASHPLFFRGETGPLRLDTVTERVERPVETSGTGVGRRVGVREHENQSVGSSDSVTQIPLREENGHARLDCEACHSRWAPQCYGCHVEFLPEQRQWDHQLGRPTRGRWREHRWGVESGAPTLGVTADGRIRPFVPGMILSIVHPDWERPRFHRLFAALSPHTTGKSRDCDSCHRSPLALGLGSGRLLRCADGWRFLPERPALLDGLPADAWTDLSGSTAGASIRSGDRSLLPEEILRVLAAGWTTDAALDKSTNDSACRSPDGRQ